MYNQPQYNSGPLMHLPRLTIPELERYNGQYGYIILDVLNQTLRGIDDPNNPVSRFAAENHYNNPMVQKVVDRLAAVFYVFTQSYGWPIDKIVNQELKSLPGDLFVAEFARMIPNPPNSLLQTQHGVDGFISNDIQPMIERLRGGSGTSYNSGTTNYNNQPQPHSAMGMNQYTGVNQPYTQKSPSWSDGVKASANDFANMVSTPTPQPTNQKQQYHDLSITPTAPTNTVSDGVSTVGGIRHYTRRNTLPNKLTQEIIDRYELSNDRDGVFINEDTYRPNADEIEVVNITCYKSYFGTVMKGSTNNPKPRQLSTLKEFSDALTEVLGSVEVDKYDVSNIPDNRRVTDIGLGFYGNLYKSVSDKGGFGFKSKPFGVLKSQVEMATDVLGADWEDNNRIDLEKDVKLIHFQGKECYLFNASNREINYIVSLYRGNGYKHHKFNLHPLDNNGGRSHWFMFNQYFNTDVIVEDIYLEDPVMDLKRHIGIAEQPKITRNYQPVVERTVEAAVENKENRQLSIEVKTQRIVANSAREALNRHTTLERLQYANYTTEEKETVIEYQKAEPFILRTDQDIQFMNEFKRQLSGQTSVNDVVNSLRNAFYSKDNITTDLLEWLDCRLGQRVCEFVSNAYGMPPLTLDQLYIHEHDSVLEILEAELPDKLYQDYLNRTQYDLVKRSFVFLDGFDLEEQKTTLVSTSNIKYNSEHIKDTIEVEANFIDDGAVKDSLLNIGSSENQSQDWLELNDDNFVALKETTRLIRTQYYLNELGITPFIDVNETNIDQSVSRRVCGASGAILELLQEVDRIDPYDKRRHDQIMTKDGFVLNVYRSPLDDTIINYVLADAR